MFEDINYMHEEIRRNAEKAQRDKQAHTMMLEMIEMLAPESKRPIFTLPVKVSHVTDKVSEIMMLAPQMDDDVGYAVKACEFLDRVEEACAAFIEQAKDAGEQHGSN